MVARRRQPHGCRIEGNRRNRHRSRIRRRRLRLHRPGHDPHQGRGGIGPGIKPRPQRHPPPNQIDLLLGERLAVLRHRAIRHHLAQERGLIAGQHRRAVGTSTEEPCIGGEHMPAARLTRGVAGDTPRSQQRRDLVGKRHPASTRPQDRLDLSGPGSEPRLLLRGSLRVLLLPRRQGGRLRIEGPQQLLPSSLKLARFAADGRGLFAGRLLRRLQGCPLRVEPLHRRRQVGWLGRLRCPHTARSDGCQQQHAPRGARLPHPSLCEHCCDHRRACFPCL